MQGAEYCSRQLCNGVIIFGLEGVADTEVKRRILPVELLDPAISARAVGVVELHAPVEAQDGKLNIEADTQTRIQAELLVKVL